MDKYLRKIFCLTLAVGIAVALSPAARAADKDVDSGQWHFEFTPYLWATGQSGTVGLANGPGNGQPFNQSFSDILSRMDIGGMAAFEARNGRWGLLLDGIYLSVSDRGSISGPNGLVSLSANGSVTQQQYAAAGFYRVLEGPTTLDALAGLRYNSVGWDVNASLASPLLPGNVISQNFAQRMQWVDPIVGVRLSHRFDEQWSIVGYADVGGSGSGSDLTWQVLGGVNYAFSPNVIGKFGYRYSSINYQSGGFLYDVATSGIYAGVGFAW